MPDNYSFPEYLRSARDCTLSFVTWYTEENQRTKLHFFKGRGAMGVTNIFLDHIFIIQAKFNCNLVINKHSGPLETC